MKRHSGGGVDGGVVGGWERERGVVRRIGTR